MAYEAEGTWFAVYKEYPGETHQMDADRASVESLIKEYPEQVMQIKKNMGFLLGQLLKQETVDAEIHVRANELRSRLCYELFF